MDFEVVKPLQFFLLPLKNKFDFFHIQNFGGFQLWN
jgi:hypothetical protein